MALDTFIPNQVVTHVLLLGTTKLWQERMGGKKKQVTCMLRIHGNKWNKGDCVVKLCLELNSVNLFSFNRRNRITGRYLTLSELSTKICLNFSRFSKHNTILIQGYYQEYESYEKCQIYKFVYVLLAFLIEIRILFVYSFIYYIAFAVQKYLGSASTNTSPVVIVK